MNNVERLNKHPLIFTIMLMGSIASIVGLTFFFLLNVQPDPTTDASVRNRIVIDSITETRREPLWGRDFFDDDEIVAVVEGSCTSLYTNPGDFKLVAFWRLANDYETNWHIAKRRIADSYELAILDGECAVAGNWDFLIGGIEVDKTYSGAVAVTLFAFSHDVIVNNERQWLYDKNGWGFEELPTDSHLAISAPVTFLTGSNR